MAGDLAVGVRLFLAGSANAGVQFMASIVYAVAGSLFQLQFKLPVFSVTVILAVMPPVCGFFTQPIVGVLSDRHTSQYGRRRPFILTGSLVCAFGLLLVAFSDLIGVALGDVPSSVDPQHHAGGIAFALLGFLLALVGSNTIQGPARAILNDLAPPNKQHLAQSLATTSQMVSAVIAPLIGAGVSYTNAQYLWLFCIGAFVVLLTGTVACIFGKEKSSMPISSMPISSATMEGAQNVVLYHGGGGIADGMSTTTSTSSSSASGQKKEAHLDDPRAPPPTVAVARSSSRFFLWHMLSTLHQTPRSLLRVLGAFFFSWCAFAPFLILDTLWFARNIYGGSMDGTEAQQQLYKEGVRMSLFNSAFFSGIGLLFSLVLPFLIKALGVKVTWLNTTVLSCVCYGLFLLVSNVIPAFAINAGIALNFIVFNTVPFALIHFFATAPPSSSSSLHHRDHDDVTAFNPSNEGLYVGLFNACALAAQGLVNLIASGVLILASQDVAWGVSLGVPFGFIAVVFVIFLPNEDAERQAQLASQAVASVLQSDVEDDFLLSGSETDKATDHDFGEFSSANEASEGSETTPEKRS